jgi:two-component system CheB/CheR fusion protein
MEKKTTTELSPNLFPVVGVGASAGGLQAFIKFISGIPQDSGMAFVLVQHLDPSHKSSLPELLQKTTNLPVLPVTDDIRIEPDHIYIIPSGKIMKASDGVLRLSPRPPKKKEERNLPIDLFFTSLADVHQDHTIGVVLSGTSTDGTEGLRVIKEHGGLTFAQDDESAQYDGMPNSAVQEGVVDFVLPPEEITGKIMKVFKQTGKTGGPKKDRIPKDVDVIYQILSLIRVRRGTDFSYYKKPTIHRRILRRMAINKIEKPSEYLKLLREDNREQDLLYQDLLIPVTSFFRDTRIFEDLCSKIFPQIVKNKKPLEPIRIWIAGCSTGQEAYSIAICFKEFLDANSSLASKDKVQIFATDVSQVAINEARKGIYDKNELENISDERLQKFFTKTNGGYQINKNLRNLCVFAAHNFLKDPPFSKIDFISCRNALIYMEPYLQKKALTTFHYALNPKQFLLLGKSETASSVPDLFEPVNKHEKLFVRKDKPGAMYLDRQIPVFEANSFSSIIQSRNEPAKTDFQKTADEVLLKRYTPPGVVINEAMDIVQFRGSTGAYLEPSSGKPDFNLLMMAKPGLSFELRNILHKAKTTNKNVVKEKIPFEINGMPVTIKLEAIPLPNMADQHYLVLFESSGVPSSTNAKAKSKTQKGKGGKQEEPDQNVLRTQQLEQELAQTKEDMATFMEEQEAVNEELQSANEELLSSSEELQSVNEELETSSEELQSTNEELTIVNQELAAVNEHIRDEKNNIESVLASIPVSLLVLDKTLRVKIANEEFYRTFKVNERETENKLVYTLGNGQWNIPQLKTLLESILPQKTTFRDFEVTRDFKNIGKRHMLLNAREINNYLNEKLILLVIEDITEKKLAEESRRESEIRYADLLKNLPIATYSCDAQGYLTYYNKAAVNLWGREPIIGKEKWSGSEKIFRMDGTQVPLEESPVAIALKEGKYERGEEFIIESASGKKFFVVSFPQVNKDSSGKITGAIDTLIDISSQKKAQQDSEQIQQQKDDFIGIASHELKTPITVIKSYSQILETLLKEKGNLKEAAMTAKMVAQVDKINNLIIDLLDTTKINRGKLVFNDTDFDFNEMVKEVLEDMKSTIRTHEIIFESGHSCNVHADRERIAQVLENFITNAVKYSPKADKIIVQTELKENEIVLSVVDFGIGIDADKKDRIFEQFYRVIGKGVPNTYPGIGLGLFISSEIVKRENGKIWVESEKDKGSVFYFSLPCAG